MPVAAVGMIFAAVGTAVSVSMNAQAQSKAAANRRKAAEEEAKWRQEQLDFAKKQYARWEQDFGEIQTEVADYYKNLTDDILKQQYEDANAEANQSLVKNYFQAQKNLSSQFNKTGMAGSGAEAASTLQLQQSMLQQKATNRWQTEQLKANANNVLMGQKQQWVSQGENLRNQATSLQASALSEAANSAAADKRLYAEMEYKANQNMINSAVSGLMNMGGALVGLGGQMYTADTMKNIAQKKAYTPTITTSSITQVLGSETGYTAVSPLTGKAEYSWNQPGNNPLQRNITSLYTKRTTDADFLRW